MLADPSHNIIILAESPTLAGTIAIAALRRSWAGIIATNFLTGDFKLDSETLKGLVNNQRNLSGMFLHIIEYSFHQHSPKHSS
jgi:hypothetical protein